MDEFSGRGAAPWRGLGAMRDYWRSERDFSEAAIIAAVEILLAIGAFWVSLRWGRNQKRVREWRWDEGMKDTAEK